MKTIQVGDFANATPAARELCLTASRNEAVAADQRHAENLLRQVIVQVRAVLATATVVQVEILECTDSGCGEKHPYVTEVRAGDDLLWYSKSPDDPHDNVSGPWGDRGRGPSVHQQFAGALDWDPDDLAGFYVPSNKSDVQVFELRFEV